MHAFLKNITRAVVLPFFLMYALSPIYFSSVSEDAGIADFHPADNTFTIGMVWLSFLIDSIDLEQREPGFSRSTHAVQAEEQDEMILIKKKRVLTRESFKLAPIFEIVAAEPPQAGYSLTFASTFDIPRDLIHTHSDGYNSLGTGLSPPSLLS